MIKKHFRLEREDDWPPARLESLWCDEVDGMYQVRNTPFFISGLAFDDVFRVLDEEEGEIVSWELIRSSGNSTLWAFFRDENVEHVVLSQLSQIGCGFEGGAVKGLYAVNIPEACSIAGVEDVLSPHEIAGSVETAYPADRHEK